MVAEDVEHLCLGSLQKGRSLFVRGVQAVVAKIDQKIVFTQAVDLRFDESVVLLIRFETAWTPEEVALVVVVEVTGEINVVIIPHQDR